MGRPHKHPDYPGISSKKNRKGETIWRYRAKGRPDVTLPGEPGDECFHAAYQKAVNGSLTIADIVDLPGRALPYTFGKAQRLLEQTMEWIDYDDATKDKNSRMIEAFLEMQVDPDAPLKWRDVPVKFMTAKHLRAIITGIYATRKTVAKHTLVAIRKLIKVAIDEQWIEPEDDPSLTIQVRLPEAESHKPWPKDIRRRFEARHPPGSAARTCYALGLWMGNRRGDIANLAWEHLVIVDVELDDEIVEVEAFHFHQHKNRKRTGGKEMFIPVVDVLADALAPLDRSKGGTVLKTAYGNAFSEKSLTNQMAVWCQQADVPPGYTLHGLRSTFGTYLAECDLQARTLMTAMGHSSMKVTDKYIQQINDRRMMVIAAKAINEREAKQAAKTRRSALRLVK
ncbi:integrase [Ensifer sp. MPMI2T]|nr:integrase [Ensifer sp. MPMI2T]